MDTKFQSKTLSPYSKIYRLVTLTLAFLFIAAGALASCEKEMVFRSYFYDCPNIKTEVIRYAKHLQRYYIYYKSFDPTVAERKLNELDEYLKDNKGVISDTDSYNSSYYKVDSTYDTSHLDDINNKSIYMAEKPEALYSFTKESLEDSLTEDVVARELELSEILQNYYSVRNYLDTTDHFHFYIYNTTSGRLVATNADNFNKETVFDSINIADELFGEAQFNNVSISDSFIKNGLECVISIPVSTNSYLIQKEVSAVQKQLKFNKFISNPLTTLLLFVVGFGILLSDILLYKNHLFNENREMYNRFKKIPLVVKLTMLAVIVFFYAGVYEKDYYLSKLLSSDRPDSILVLLISALVAIVVASLVIKNIVLLLRNPKSVAEETDVRFILVSIRNFRFAISTQNYLLIFIYMSVAMVFLMGVTVLIYAVPFALTSYKSLVFCLIFSVPVVITAIVIKLINAHIKLCWYIKEISLGNIEVIPPQKGVFTAPLNDLNNINDGMKRTMEEAIKNERLKSELITNVSHDLKTPLTSIISYVNLLKQIKPGDERAKDYIDVIENKATRLKILIDDLFEASKLSSGQMKLDINPSDVVSLLKQTLGELSYKIEESGIEFKTNLPDTPVILNMDGQKMWRVFDNMINNILKYSPENSRAYVDLTEHNDKVLITFKNVSSYPLDFDTGELFERFKRGDAARATEGSGLGLSIAKSIVELHGGNMKIVTDGDLFKVLITLYRKK